MERARFGLVGPREGRPFDCFGMESPSGTWTTLVSRRPLPLVACHPAFVATRQGPYRWQVKRLAGVLDPGT